MNIKNNYQVVAYCIINFALKKKQKKNKAVVQGREQTDTCGRCISQGLYKKQMAHPSWIIRGGFNKGTIYKGLGNRRDSVALRRLVIARIFITSRSES